MFLLPFFRGFGNSSLIMLHKGVIGTGLFVGSGQALYIGGPGYLLVAYILTSMLVYGVLTAVIEVATYLPVEGASMAFYAGRFVSRSVGFALGWLYFYCTWTA